MAGRRPGRVLGALALVVALAVWAALALGAPAVPGTAEIRGYGAISFEGNALAASASSAGPEQGGAGGALSVPGGSAGSAQIELSAGADGPAGRAEGTVFVSNVNLLSGRIVASSLTMSVIAAAGPNGVEAGLTAASAPALTIDGAVVSASPGSRHPVPGVGTLVMFEQVSDGAGRVRANALRLEVTEADALPVGEIVIGHLDASATAGAAATPEPEPEPEPEPDPTTSTGTTTAPPADDDGGAGTTTAPAREGRDRDGGERERGERAGTGTGGTTTPARTPDSPPTSSAPAPPAAGPAPAPMALGVPRMDAPLIPATDAPYAFPVAGEASYTDDYGAPRPGTGWHHGNDIFAPTGTPVVAVADGTLFSVGVNTLGGNRLWLRDEAGNEFYYAHLSAYARQTTDGVRVQAGEVIAFVGNTGQAITTPPHLHFEIHPAGGESINPYPYLLAWERGSDVPRAFLAAAEATPGDGGAPGAGAVLVGVAPAEATPPAPGDGLARAAG